MKLLFPEISWHNRTPVLCVDIIPNGKDEYKLATGGNDNKVYIWGVDNSGILRIISGLRRHQRPIGALRFSPVLTILASGDDDGYIYLWKLAGDEGQQNMSSFMNDDDLEDQEIWKQSRVLRGHVEDICDLSWSKDGTLLLSGSVDNSTILWDTEKGTKVWVSDLVQGWVQGVSLDPLNEFMASISSDRILRVYKVDDKKVFSSTKGMRLPNHNYKKAMFCSDTLQTFCRRQQFSPCGQFLLVPSGIVTSDDSPSTSVCYLFKRGKFNKPFLYYPTKEHALCVAFCPEVFELRPSPENVWQLSYRLVFAIATLRSVIIYDSQHLAPIGYVSNIHFARLTDLAWSSDSRILITSSYDGYCSILMFDEKELGNRLECIPVQEPEVIEIIEPEPPQPPKPPTPPKPDIRKYFVRST